MHLVKFVGDLKTPSPKWKNKKKDIVGKKKKKAGKPKTEILHGKSVFYCKQNEQKNRFFWFQQYFELVVHDYAYV